MSPIKKQTWTTTKALLSKKSNTELLKLIYDLYALSPANKSFVDARFCAGPVDLKPYKAIISDAVYPDIQRDKQINFKFNEGKKAISDYFKATNDALGKLELMTYYLEMGNQFTVDYGDISASFYSSLESMFKRILSELTKHPENIQYEYLERLESVVDAAGDVGWGYHDTISELYEEFIADEDG